jgi:rhodanese-related sulfurtransferase
MSKKIDRDELRRMMAEGHAQLIDVLPADEFESEHIAGAANLPLKRLDRETAARLDRGRPLIVYCNDFQ